MGTERDVAFRSTASATVPVFAVAMPTYNAEATVAEAIESVLAQRFEAWELSIVDDGSIDSTLAIVERYAVRDSRIRVVHQENAGCGPARARAISLSKAAYIMHFDNDDVLAPECMERFAKHVSDHPGFDIYSCNAEWFRDDGSCGRYFDGPGFDCVRSFSLDEVLAENIILSAAAIITRGAYSKVGGIRDDAPVEDYDLWVRVLAHGGRHLYLPETLVRYRRSARQMSLGVVGIFEGNASVLRDLEADLSLPSEVRWRIRGAAERHSARAAAAEASSRRRALEQRLMEGECVDARREYLATRAAYASTAKYGVGLAVVLVSPRLYASWLRRRARKSPQG
jgi:glycosyltransferase involved in cell wall biosynthesis